MASTSVSVSNCPNFLKQLGLHLYVGYALVERVFRVVLSGATVLVGWVDPTFVLIK